MGQDPASLPFTVDWSLLIASMKENLNSYWVGWATRLDRFLVMLSDWGIQWVVLGVLRQYYTLRENAITTKIKAAEYAIANLPEDWHTLIQEAINIRAGKKASRYRSRLLRMVHAVRFLRYVIQLANR